VFPVWVPLRPPVGRFVRPSVWWSAFVRPLCVGRAAAVCWPPSVLHSVCDIHSLHVVHRLRCGALAQDIQRKRLCVGNGWGARDIDAVHLNCEPFLLHRRTMNPEQRRQRRAAKIPQRGRVPCRELASARRGRRRVGLCLARSLPRGVSASQTN